MLGALQPSATKTKNVDAIEDGCHIEVLFWYNFWKIRFSSFAFSHQRTSGERGGNELGVINRGSEGGDG